MGSNQELPPRGGAGGLSRGRWVPALPAARPTTAHPCPLLAPQPQQTAQLWGEENSSFPWEPEKESFWGWGWDGASWDESSRASGTPGLATLSLLPSSPRARGCPSRCQHLARHSLGERLRGLLAPPALCRARADISLCSSARGDAERALICSSPPPPLPRGRSCGRGEQWGSGCSCWAGGRRGRRGQSCPSAFPAAPSHWAASAWQGQDAGSRNRGWFRSTPASPASSSRCSLLCLHPGWQQPPSKGLGPEPCTSPWGARRGLEGSRGSAPGLVNSPKALPTHPAIGNPQLQPHKLGPCHPAQGTPGPCGLSEPCQAPGHPVQPWFPVAQLQLARPLLIFPAQQLPPAVNELSLSQPLPARGRGPTARGSRHPPCIRRAVVRGRDTTDVGAGLMMP